MKFNASMLTNIGLIIFFITILLDKVFFAPINNMKWGYGIGAFLVIIGTMMYFLRKR